MASVIYIVLKYAAYAGWCYAGLKYVGVRRADLIALALGFGRQLMGIVATPAAIYFAYFPLMEARCWMTPPKQT